MKAPSKLTTYVLGFLLCAGFAGMFMAAFDDLFGAGIGVAFGASIWVALLSPSSRGACKKSTPAAHD